MTITRKMMVLIALVSLGAALAILLVPRLRGAKEYRPTDAQVVRLLRKRTDAVLANVTKLQADQAFAHAMSELMAECEAVRVENKWPAEVTCNPDTLMFSVPPAPPKEGGKK